MILSRSHCRFFTFATLMTSLLLVTASFAQSMTDVAKNNVETGPLVGGGYYLS